jgi:hypothetical protein
MATSTFRPRPSRCLCAQHSSIMCYCTHLHIPHSSLGISALETTTNGWNITKYGSKLLPLFPPPSLAASRASWIV